MGYKMGWVNEMNIGVEHGVLMILKTWGRTWGANDFKIWGGIWGANDFRNMGWNMGCQWF